MIFRRGNDQADGWDDLGKLGRESIESIHYVPGAVDAEKKIDPATHFAIA